LKEINNYYEILVSFETLNFIHYEKKYVSKNMIFFIIENEIIINGDKVTFSFIVFTYAEFLITEESLGKLFPNFRRNFRTIEILYLNLVDQWILRVS